MTAPPVNLTTATVILIAAGLLATGCEVRAAVRGPSDNPVALARKRARWAGAVLTGLLTVGAAGIAVLRAVA